MEDDLSISKVEYLNISSKKLMKKTFNKSKRTINLLSCSASVAFRPAQANCLSLGEINSSQLVTLKFGIGHAVGKAMLNIRPENKIRASG